MDECEEMDECEDCIANDNYYDEDGNCLCGECTLNPDNWEDGYWREDV